MAHNIKERDVQVGVKMAWHGLTQIETDINRDNCRINYPMGIVPTYFPDNEGGWTPSGNRQIVSFDDNLPIGRSVGEDYKLISNAEIFEAVESGLAGTNHKIVSCGTVADRSKGFVSVKVADDFEAAGRKHEPVLNVIWGHGGNMALYARTGITTVVCQNTLTLAMGQGESKLAMRHTAGANALDLAKAIDAHIGIAAEFRAALDSLANVKADDIIAREIYTGTLTDGETPEHERGQTRLANRVETMVGFFRSGPGNRGENMADVLNGFTQFFTHDSAGEDKRKQYVASEFGSASVAKTRFFGELLDGVAVAKLRANGAKVIATLAQL